MQKEKNPPLESVFHRARGNDSERNADIVNGDKIEKKRVPGTEGKYARALEL